MALVRLYMYYSSSSGIQVEAVNSLLSGSGNVWGLRGSLILIGDSGRAGRRLSSRRFPAEQERPRCWRKADVEAASVFSGHGDRRCDDEDHHACGAPPVGRARHGHRRGQLVETEALHREGRGFPGTTAEDNDVAGRGIQHATRQQARQSGA